MWFWRRIEKNSWTDRVRNEVLQRVKEEMNILHTIRRRKVNWIGLILRRNCLLKHVIEGEIDERIDVTVPRGRIRKQLLHNLKKMKEYWKLKDEALDRTLWRTRFRKGNGPFARQSIERINETLFSSSQELSHFRNFPPLLEHASLLLHLYNPVNSPTLRQMKSTHTLTSCS
jgi:hypothetical protein